MVERHVLPAGYSARSATRDDAESAAELISASRAPLGESLLTTEELLDDWAEGEDLAGTTTVIEDPDGRIVAMGDLVNRRYMRVSIYGYVHPSDEGRGLGSFLVQWGEQWVRTHLDQAPDGVQVIAEFYVNARNEAARRLLETHEYRLARTVYVMEITLEGPPPAPQWPDGIEVRNYRPGEDDRSLYEVGETAFADMWGRPPGTLEGWTGAVKAPGFDPSLWYLPIDRATGKPAGFCLCTLASGTGWVRSLGIHPSWRHRGLGLALLRQAFTDFYRRGIEAIGLSVDAKSPTGAPRLYTRAGMHVAHSYHIYRKEIRPGRDFTGALE